MWDRIIDCWLIFRGILLYNFKFKKMDYWNKEKIEKYQYKKLKKLLLICQNDVPYYRDLFKKIDFDTNRDFKALSDLKKIPITTKEDVRRNPNAFVNEKCNLKRTIRYGTSGSTGEPLEGFLSYNQFVAEEAVVWQHWARGGYKFRDMMGIVRSCAPKKGEPLIKMEKLRNFRYYSPFHLTDENMKMYLEDMIKNKVVILRGYPSSLKTLADYVQRTNCEVPKIKMMLTASEILSDGDRAVIERAFNSRIFNYFGMAEGIVAFGDCEKHQGMHNFEGYGYLELLDTDNPNIKQIIGTCLNNTAMPFLRYKTNDLAEVAFNTCECGRTSKLVHNIIGRSNQIMKLRDREIPLTNFFTVLEHYPQIKSWQIVLTTLDSVELRVAGDFDEKFDREIREAFSDRLPSSVSFDIRYNAEKDLIKRKEGKKPTFVSLVEE